MLLDQHTPLAASRCQIVEAQLTALMDALDARSSTACVVIDQLDAAVDAGDPQVIKPLLAALRSMCVPIDVDMQVYEEAALRGALAAAGVN